MDSIPFEYSNYIQSLRLVRVAPAPELGPRSNGDIDDIDSNLELCRVRQRIIWEDCCRVLCSMRGLKTLHVRLRGFWLELVSLEGERQYLPPLEQIKHVKELEVAIDWPYPVKGSDGKKVWGGSHFFYGECRSRSTDQVEFVIREGE